MKTITNTSMQGWSLPVRTPEGVKSHYLSPRSSVKVPDSYLTDHIKRFAQRQLITIQNA